MKLTIEGESQLFKRLNGLNEVMQRTFWIGVQEDYEENLLDNVRPHTKEGKMERNTRAKLIDGGVEGGVYNNGMEVTWNGQKINYAYFVEYGTKPHEIRPKKKKILRWQGAGGGDVFAGVVNHPGTKAYKPVENAAKKTFNNLDKIFTQELKSRGIT